MCMCMYVYLHMFRYTVYGTHVCPCPLRNKALLAHTHTWCRYMCVSVCVSAIMHTGCVGLKVHAYTVYGMHVLPSPPESKTRRAPTHIR